MSSHTTTAATKKTNTLTRAELLDWLHEEDSARLGELWRQADAVRHCEVGDAVHLRGLIELSNYCVRQCGYCGIRFGNTLVRRYRMSFDEIIACAAQAHQYGYGTVVLQAGEDYGLDTVLMVSIIERIKKDFNLAVTLSLGERPLSDLQAWRTAGADRYLMRFETSNRALYDDIHPPLPGQTSDRVALLGELRRMGYEIGSGVMIGIPGQSYDDLVNDLELFRALDLDMIGVGPYIPHAQTPLGQNQDSCALPPGRQVPATEAMCYKVVALTRLVCPRANIPATSALATVNLATGRETALQRGANILMPNLTPVQYRSLYEIYPAKACINETARQCQGCMTGRIRAIGRTPGQGPGSALR